MKKIKPIVSTIKEKDKSLYKLGDIIVSAMPKVVSK